jgi:sigma-B regulation protein RsbU (phosphoserine phosphatase)
MEKSQLDNIHSHLSLLRDKLNDTAGLPEHSSYFSGLRKEVDNAISRIENGTYGICELCHEEIGNDNLQSDPLMRICFSHYTDEQKQVIEKDLEMAFRIQSNLLPGSGKEIKNWDIKYHYEPHGVLSGDFYDVISSAEKEGELFFLFGDISGKGISAALLMSNLNAIFKTLAASELGLKNLIETANRLFCGNTLPAHFATLVCGRATHSGGIELSNAGHCRPLVLTPGGTVPVESTGLPLGIYCNTEYSTIKLALNEGDTLFLYTDGLTETKNKSENEYGEARLLEFISPRINLAPEELISSVLSDVNQFRAGVPASDDITVMAIKRN